MKKYTLFHLYIFTTILLIELYHFNIDHFSPYPIIEILDPPLVDGVIFCNSPWPIDRDRWGVTNAAHPAAD